MLRLLDPVASNTPEKLAFILDSLVRVSKQRTCSLHTISSVVHGRCRQKGGPSASGSSFSPSQRTFHCSWRRSLNAKCGTLSRMSIGPRTATSRNNTAAAHKETRSLSLKANDQKMLMLLMSWFCGGMVIIRKTATVNAVRCEVCIIVVSSPSLPNSMPHEILLSVTTSGWHHNVTELSLLAFRSCHCLVRPTEARHLRWCEVQTSDGPLALDSVSFIVDTIRA